MGWMIEMIKKFKFSIHDKFLMWGSKFCQNFESFKIDLKLLWDGPGVFRGDLKWYFEGRGELAM